MVSGASRGGLVHSNMTEAFAVYILASQRNGTLYIGVTRDLVRRVDQHKAKGVPGFTRRYDVTRLVYVERFQTPLDAIAREKQLKGWRREKKLGLIEGFNPEWKALEETMFDGRNAPTHVSPARTERGEDVSSRAAGACESEATHAEDGRGIPSGWR